MVISLGGSLIIPGEVNKKYLDKFKKIILKNKKNYNFIIVCGGGSVARKYISAIGNDNFFQSLARISATRMNARFMYYFFGINPHYGIPHTMKTVDKYLDKYGIVFCGALEYKPKQTSDSTAAEIAKHFKANFINLTNVRGLYDKNPKEYKDAEFIPRISWKDFDIRANKMKFKPGQHFVLDQTASKIILKNKITTFITGLDINQLDNLLSNKNFNGTMISG